MRVLQLIDSLRSGGAERMSINYANALAKRIDASFLCCTRMEGLLKSQLAHEVGYLFLSKKNTLDPQAFLRLRQFVKANKIDIIHAHGNSWFLALLVKFSLPEVKLIWHDHWGERALRNLPPRILKPASKFFDGILSVNPALENWAQTNLLSSSIKYLPNFIQFKYVRNRILFKGTSILKGEHKGFKIICLANLRPQKDHLTLLQSLKQVVEYYPNTSLHLIGKDEHSAYSKNLKKFVKENGLKDKVFFYGEQVDVEKFLIEADIGVLSSKTEGLPMALLEYGMCRLPVVCTQVGQCEEVVKECGISVPSEDSQKFSEAIILYMSDPHLREKHSNSFYFRVVNNFSQSTVIDKAIKFYSNLK